MFNSHHPRSAAAVTSLLLAMAGIVALPAAFAQQPNQETGGASTFPINNSKSVQGNPAANTGPLTAVPEDFADLKLAAGFLLDIQVYDEPEMSTHVRVDKDGNISLPLIGSVHIAGMNISSAENAIQVKFRQEEIFKNPQVTLNIEQYASANVTVLGEVQSPGRIQLLAPHSLLDVIGMAGGETNLAGDVIEVRTPTPQGTSNQAYHYARNSNGSSIRDVLVQPGDTVTIARAGIVYVLGAVNRPGGYVMQEDGRLDVVQALSLAQGTSLTAKTGALRVVRHTADGQIQEIPVSYKDMVDGKVKPLTLQAEDVVYVPVSKLKSAFTSGASIIGQTGSAAIIHP